MKKKQQNKKEKERKDKHKGKRKKISEMMSVDVITLEQHNLIFGL